MAIKCNGIFESPKNTCVIFLILLIEDAPPMFCSVAPQMSSVQSNVIGPNPHRLFQVIDIDRQHDVLQIIVGFWNKETRVFTIFCQSFIKSPLNVQYKGTILML